MWLVTAFWAMNSSFAPSNDQLYLNYIERYKDIAIQEMQRTGIPASIKLAQAIQESGAGTSELAQNANNHFGIKCASDWTGPTYYRKDDDYNDDNELIESCFRAYSSPEQSFIEHSAFLQRPRYSTLFQLNPTDYKAWARGLQNAGYATDQTYATRLIDLIERFHLDQYDKKGAGANDHPIVVVPAPTPKPTPVNQGYFVENDVKYIMALPNEPLSNIAARTGTSVNELLDYNDNFQGADQYLSGNARIYLQPKRDFYRGRQKYHVVKNGETMFDISQQYALKLDKLYDRNRMAPGTQPTPNEEIKLRGSKVKTAPRLASEATASSNQDPGYLFEEPIVSKPQPTKDPVPSLPNTPPADTSQQQDTSFDTDPFEKPTTTPSPTPTPEIQYHIVKAGDTLWNISQRYGTTVDQLKQWNHLTSNTINLGMQLRVK